jgi:hypothetical protein
MSFRLTGMNQLTARLQREFDRMENGSTEAGLTAGMIQASGYASELTPVGETSNLINSQYIFVERSVNGWRAGIGYTANYAEPTHDGGEKNWQKASATDLYLKKAFENNTAQILRAIAIGSSL